MLKKFGPMSEEHKRKISLATMGKNKGKVPWNKGLRDCYADETINMMSKAKKNVLKYPEGHVKYHSAIHKELIEYKGGRCIVCGMTNEQSILKWGSSLEFHHTHKKNFDMWYGIVCKRKYPYLEQLVDEAEITVVLCKSCHARESCFVRWNKPEKSLLKLN